MSMISKFKSVPPMIAPEPKAEDVVNNPGMFGVDTPKFPVPKVNIPEPPKDEFESVDPLKTGIFVFTQKPSRQDQMVHTEPAVDASTLFSYLAGNEEPQPPASPEPPERTMSVSSALVTNNSDPVDDAIRDAAKLLEDASYEALDAGFDVYNAVVKFGSDVGDVAEDVVDELAKPVGDLMYGNAVNDVVDFVSSEIVDRGLNGMRDIGLEKEADWVQNTGGDVIRFAGDAAKKTANAAEDAIDWMGEAASDVGDFAEDVVDAVADPVYDVMYGDAIDDVKKFGSDVLDEIGEAGEDALDAAGDAASDAADAAGDVIDDIGDAAGDGLDAAGDAAGDVGDWLGDLW
jgi:hypothetical protein